MKTCLLAILLIAAPVLAIDDSIPFTQETQLKLLKTLRQFQDQQLKIKDLQRQFDQASLVVRQIQDQLEADCAAAAKDAKVDLTKYNCDLDKLSFVPKPAPHKPDAPK
ncbi:MAG TPA: hypothetical protein VMW17_05430 [Candidatus Binatia bacterium]|nr:hypothetical protein [Candidatus Binatia bacterium]